MALPHSVSKEQNPVCTWRWKEGFPPHPRSLGPFPASKELMVRVERGRGHSGTFSGDQVHPPTPSLSLRTGYRFTMHLSVRVSEARPLGLSQQLSLGDAEGPLYPAAVPLGMPLPSQLSKPKASLKASVKCHLCQEAFSDLKTLPLLPSAGG